MADQQLPEGLTIKYQDKLCGGVFEFTRPTGLEPGDGMVFMSLDEFKEYKIVESISGTDEAPKPGVTQEKKGTSKRGLQSSGALVFAEVVVEDGKREEHVVTIQNVLLTERGVESAFAFDDENDLSRIPLTDIRELWKTRGLVTAWVNVPKNGAGLPAEKGGGGPSGSKPGTSSAGSTVGPDSKSSLGINDPNAVAGAVDPSFRKAVNKLLNENGIDKDPEVAARNSAGRGLSINQLQGAPATQTQPLDTSNSALYIRGSTNNGAPRTLRYVLEKIVLPALPGNPKLNRLPKELENAHPIGHKWNGELPKKCLRDLLDEFQLTLSLDLDSNVSLWARGEGPGEDRIRLAGSAGRPDGGDITINTKNPSCDPRCATSKKLVNFRWLPTCVVVLGPPVIVTERLRLEAVGEINGTVLPLQDALETIGLTMDKAQQLVLARVSDRVGLPFGLTEHGLREFDRWAFKYFRVPGGADAQADKLPILNARGAVTKAGELHPVKVFSESHTVVSIMGKKIAQAPIKSGKALGVGTEQQKSATAAAIELIKSANPSDYLVTVNLPFSEQASGWELDAARGIVKFHEPQGLCVADGVALDTYKALLAPSAAVELEFAHTLKPGANDDIELGFRYFSVWMRGQDGKATQANAIPPGSAPLVIERAELQEIRGPEGETNKSTLDGFAKKFADAVFSTPQSEVGAVATFGRPVPAINTGQALSIRWFTEDECPRTEVHVNSFGPFHPDSDLRTRAFGIPDGRGRDLDSPIVPRGVK
jgi:hypothetical protein